MSDSRTGGWIKPEIRDLDIAGGWCEPWEGEPLAQKCKPHKHKGGPAIKQCKPNKKNRHKPKFS